MPLYGSNLSVWLRLVRSVAQSSRMALSHSTVRKRLTERLEKHGKRLENGSKSIEISTLGMESHIGTDLLHELLQGPEEPPCLLTAIGKSVPCLKQHLKEETGPLGLKSHGTTMENG